MNKTEIKNKIVKLLQGEIEIQKIIIFGSFNKSNTPNDKDFAIVQNSSENYLSSALKYRKLIIRNVSREIAVDLFPILPKKRSSIFERELGAGEVIYERRSENEVRNYRN